MANTLTNLIPQVYSALDIVSRELVGFIPSVTRDPTTTRAAVGQTVYSFVTPAATATNITPGVTPPNDGDQTIGSQSLTITKARRVPFRWNGEEQLGLNNNGAGYGGIRRDQISQAIRTLTNEMETDLAVAAALGASRAWGTAGSTPFATNLADPAQVRKILDDNGTPPGDRQLLVNTASGAAMRTLTQLTKANESQDATMLRQGTLLDIHNFQIRESAQVQRPAIGTAAGSTTNAAGYAVGTTAITLAAAGTGTIVAGDVITFAGDTNKYVVASGNVNVAAGGALTIALPGLRLPIAAAATAVTVVAISSKNVAFRRSALILAARLPALPDGGDLAVDRATVTDPYSGFSFEIAMYPQYRQMQYEISAAWGVKAIKSEHISLLLGE